jgi:hypothetical protein
MASYNFDFAFIQEKVIEPLFRKVNNIKLLANVSLTPQTIHDDWMKNIFPVYEDRARWNSTKLTFEYMLNDVFNTTQNPIYIENTPNEDINTYLYRVGEATYSDQVYLFNDNGQGILTYPSYNPFAAYTENTIVTNQGLLYVCIADNPPYNSIYNKTYWLLNTYLYNDNDYLSLIDFVVFVPQSLFTSQFDIQIKGFIEQHKLFNTKYTIQYYI